MFTETRTVRYFIDRFQAGSVQDAVEKAAAHLRPWHLGKSVGPGEAATDVRVILREHGVRVVEPAGTEAPRVARLVPEDRGFRIEVNPSQSPNRLRFSIAHELAHSLFYRDVGDGPRHQIAALRRTERDAEEWICDRVASSLLIPTEVVLERFAPATISEPWELADRIDRVARELRVTVSALVTRLCNEPRCELPFLLAVLRGAPNRVTGIEPRLRIVSAQSLTRRSRIVMWSNGSARRYGLDAARRLFEAWAGDWSDRRAGRFALRATNVLTEWPSCEGPPLDRVVGERLVGWQRSDSGWSKQIWQSSTFQTLYSPSNAKVSDARVLVCATVPEG